jgi:hypothetical protein
LKKNLLWALFEDFDKNGTVSLAEFKACLKKVNVLRDHREALAKGEEDLNVFRADQAKQYDSKRS